MMAFLVLIFIVACMAIGGFFLYKYFKENINHDAEKETYIPTTQDNIPVDSIRQGIVKLKNGSYCAVIKVPSLNIELMEYEEKQIILEKYKQILTSIDFSFQFLQQSRIVDVSDYLKKLSKIQSQADNIFVKKQLEFYRGYIIELIRTRVVLTKKFFLIIPFDDELEKRKRAKNSTSPLDLKLNKKNIKIDEKNDVLEEEKRFEIARKQLSSRVSLIVRSFGRFDISPEQLNDEGLTELFYTSYNKARSVYQPLPVGAQNDFTTFSVRKGEDDK